MSSKHNNNNGNDIVRMENNDDDAFASGGGIPNVLELCSIYKMYASVCVQYPVTVRHYILYSYIYPVYFIFLYRFVCVAEWLCVCGRIWLLAVLSEHSLLLLMLLGRSVCGCVCMCEWRRRWIYPIGTDLTFRFKCTLN